MSFTIDWDTEVGQVRALTGDVTEATAFMQDEQIETILNLEAVDHDILMAAGFSLMSMANNRAIIGKRIKLLDLDIDTGSMATILRQQADKYFELAFSDFDIANMLLTVSSRRDYLYNLWYSTGEFMGTYNIDWGWM